MLPLRADYDPGITTICSGWITERRGRSYKIDNLRSKSASGEDFASTGSFATPCNPRNSQQVSNRDVLDVL